LHHSTGQSMARRRAFTRLYRLTSKRLQRRPRAASFMSFKASCLRDAGVITEGEKQWVDARVLSVLAGEMIAAGSGSPEHS
jgi:hypothetical protein